MAHGYLSSVGWLRGWKSRRTLLLLLLLTFGLASMEELTLYAAAGPYIGGKSGPGVESCQACGHEQHLYNPTSSKVEVVVSEERRHPSDSSWNTDEEDTYQLGPNSSQLLGCNQGMVSGTCTLTYSWTIKSWKKVN